jgi:hypothetical protein
MQPSLRGASTGNVFASSRQSRCAWNVFNALEAALAYLPLRAPQRIMFMRQLLRQYLKLSPMAMQAPDFITA